MIRPQTPPDNLVYLIELGKITSIKLNKEITGDTTETFVEFNGNPEVLLRPYKKYLILGLSANSDSLARVKPEALDIYQQWVDFTETNKADIDEYYRLKEKLGF